MKWFPSVGLFFLAAATVCAQVEVQVNFPQEQYLAHEKVIADVRIKNLSGQSINLGAEPRWLTFSVQSSSGSVVRRLDELQVTARTNIESTEIAVYHVNLQPFFELLRSDQYKVRATVKIPNWSEQFTSPETSFEIASGTKLWEQDFGVPPMIGRTNADPEVRKYALVEANFKQQIRLYMRLSNQRDNQVFALQYIGPMVSVGNPEAQLDKFSNLHVLYQCDARASRYNIFDPRGMKMISELYDYSPGGRARLGMDAEGKIYVRGGILHGSQPPAPVTPVALAPRTNAVAKPPVKTARPTAKTGK